MGVFLFVTVSCDSGKGSDSGIVSDSGKGGDSGNDSDSGNGSFTDPRDGKSYETVTIGNQVWMAENLAYEPTSGNYCASDNDKSNVETYGYLYNWQTALNVCPVGWHLPSDNEWKELTTFVGFFDSVKKLKAKSGWSDNGNGSDDYGFTALPGGECSWGGALFFVGHSGYWWSATEANTDRAWRRSIYYSLSHVNFDPSDKESGFSVRCVRD
ncbi:MAG: hypothetical protein EA393_07315 [Bacteroidetes bacterium]|nr:MAG: hypothetical protein EA393_07315 [Bacteroidota bacterium]